MRLPYKPASPLFLFTGNLFFNDYYDIDAETAHFGMKSVRCNINTQCFDIGGGYFDIEKGVFDAEIVKMNIKEGGFDIEIPLFNAEVLRYNIRMQSFDIIIPF